MSEAWSSFGNLDDQQDGERFAIQPYQFEPRINADEAESLSGEDANVKRRRTRKSST